MQLSQRSDLDAVIFNGGTGIAPRRYYDAIEEAGNLARIWELFRWLSYQEMVHERSRLVRSLVFIKVSLLLPGSTNAVHLAMQQLILPELSPSQPAKQQT